MYYNATSRIGLYGVAIQVEDFASLTDQRPLSTVSVQFLLEVFQGNNNCSSQPEFSKFTRADKACVGIPLDKTYIERFYATSGSTEEM